MARVLHHKYDVATYCSLENKFRKIKRESDLIVAAVQNDNAKSRRTRHMHPHSVRSGPPCANPTDSNYAQPNPMRGGLSSAIGPSMPIVISQSTLFRRHERNFNSQSFTSGRTLEYGECYRAFTLSSSFSNIALTFKRWRHQFGRD
jgi:hypothetical protein